MANHIVFEEEDAGSGAISKHHYRRVTVKLEIEVEVLEVFLRLSGEGVTAGFLADGLEWKEPPRLNKRSEYRVSDTSLDSAGR